MGSKWNLWKILAVLIVIIVAVSVFLTYGASTHVEVATDTVVHKVLPTGPYIQIGTTTVAVELATTSVAVQKGLSGRPSLADDHGMLFVFQKADILRFWMPNMQFPLDMIWIHEGEVVDITEEATHIFDPSRPVFYSPMKPASRVLEVNAGFAKSHGIKIGDMVKVFNI